MSSPRLGVVRESMLTNPKLSQAPLGRIWSRGLYVPGPEFTYGISSSHKDGGVAEVLSSWQVPSERRRAVPLRPVVSDFITLNREAAKSGVVTSKELSRFRALRGPVPLRSKAQGGVASRRPPAPDITFGVTTRPPSPLSHLLCHEYAERWRAEQLSHAHSGEQKHLHLVTSRRIPDTRGTLLRRSAAVPDTHTHALFRLPQFTQVAPALDTFRDARLQTAEAARGRKCVCGDVGTV